MSGWGVITWLAAIAVGPLTFLALVAYRVADCTIGLERFEADQGRSQQLRRQANQTEIVLQTVGGQEAPSPRADRDGQRDKKVDQPLG